LNFGVKAEDATRNVIAQSIYFEKEAASRSRITSRLASWMIRGDL